MKALYHALEQWAYQRESSCRITPNILKPNVFLRLRLNVAIMGNLEFVDFSYIETQKAPLQPAPMDLKSIGFQ
jgi:hypothetical protein